MGGWWWGGEGVGTFGARPVWLTLSDQVSLKGGKLGAPP